MRLYGERGETAQTLKTMSVTTGILSDIDRLEKQPSVIEQPFLISNYKLQKKQMHRNLNKELSLPTLHFLKPTSAYFQRRQLSQEQLRAMAQKKYDLIESGLAPTVTTGSCMTRPATDANSKKRSLLGGTPSVPPAPLKDQSAAIEKFYARYGNHQNSQKFLGYLMKRNQTPEHAHYDQMTLQDFPFPFHKKNDGTGARPKSILVYPQQ